MTYSEWCKQVAQLVRENGAATVVTGEDISHGPINYLDEPRQNFIDQITPQQAANEIIRRVKTLRRA